VLCAEGRLEEATAPLEEFSRIAGVIGTPPIRATATALAGQLSAARGDHDARQHFEDAIDGFERCGARYDAAKARLTLAGLLKQDGRTDRARHEAQTALNAFRALGALADAAAAEAIVEGDTPMPEPGRGLLTQRQLEILQLVAQGMSDRGIASSLVMSEHTVHRHVANILQRLNLSTRAAAVAYATRQGLL
jgi:ATP/maltotriose-dependent transcriptional regulator MalT